MGAAQLVFQRQQVHLLFALLGQVSCCLYGRVRQLGALVYALHKNGEENTALVERYIETIAAVEKMCIRDRGGKVLFNTPLPGLRVRDGRLAAVCTPQGELPCGALLLAPGHSARDLSLIHI